jgi:lauroyl/myristoyl acyltransferase
MQNEQASQAAALPWTIRAKFAVLRGTLWLGLRVLGLTGLYQVARCFALAEWAVNYKRRRRFHQAMGGIYGAALDPAVCRRACRSYFVRTRCDKLFYLIFDFVPRQRLMKRLRFDGLEEVNAALQRGNGVYVALSHLGAHHVVGLIMNLMGYRVAGVRDPQEGPLRSYIQAMYERRLGRENTVKVLYSDNLPRDIYRCLKDNYLLGSALDADRIRDPRLKRVAVQVFGEEKHWIIGTLQIGLRCGSDIIQAFAISEPNFHYRLIRQPLLFDGEVAQDDPATIQRIMQRYAVNIERFAREHPDHISRI